MQESVTKPVISIEPENGVREVDFEEKFENDLKSGQKS